MTVSITVEANPVGVASAGRARRIGDSAEVSVACSGPIGVAHCHLTVALRLTETFAGHKLVALTTSRSKRPTKFTKVVIVGQTSMVIGAGTTKVIRVRFKVALVIRETTLSSSPQVVSRQALTLIAS